MFRTYLFLFTLAVSLSLVIVFSPSTPDLSQWPAPVTRGASAETVPSIPLRSEPTRPAVEETLPAPPEVPLSGGPGLATPIRDASRLLSAPVDRVGFLEVIRNDPDSRRRHWAIFDLVNRYGVDAEAADALIDLLQKTDDPDLLSVALWGLARVRTLEAVAAVAQLAGASEIQEVQIEAVKTLATQGTDEAVEALGTILEGDAGDPVRTRAAAMIGLVGTAKAQNLERLERVVSIDPSPAVRGEALRALGTSTGLQARQALARIAQTGVTPGERALARHQLETAELVAGGGGDLTDSFTETEHPLAATATQID